MTQRPKTRVDVVVAAADLVARAGATEFEIAWDCPHVPDEGDDHYCPDITWTCSARYKGHRVFSPAQPDPGQAANGLAVEIFDGAMCRCGEPVALFTTDGCWWSLQGNRWEPGCDAPPLAMGRLGIERGDLAGMNRAARRRMKKDRK